MDFSIIICNFAAGRVLKPCDDRHENEENKM